MNQKANMASCIQAMLQRQLRMAYNKWREAYGNAGRELDLMHAAMSKMRRMALRRAWNKWWDILAGQRNNSDKQAAFAKCWLNRWILKAWNSWRFEQSSSFSYH